MSAAPDLSRILAELQDVPDSTRFLTVDELYAQAREAARAHPDLAHLQVVGHSTDGEAIPMLTIGDGPVPLLFYACPHPNEPIGAMLVSYLTGRLLRDPDFRAGYTWHLLPCVDPDGTRLNEGWFAGPFTIRTYARHFYRPPGTEQVEWTFPAAHKTYRFDAPIPETRALMYALETVRPAFVYSLHNAGFGGVYYYLSRALPGVYPALHALPGTLGLVLATGEAEMPWAVTLAPAIYRDSGVAEAYDHFEALTDGDPAALIGSGGSSRDFLNTLPGPRALALVTELPFFEAPAVADLTPCGQTRREVLLAGHERRAQLTRQVEALLAPVRPLMTLDSRLYRAAQLFHAHFLAGEESGRQAILNDARTLDPASVAQRADALYVASFYQLLLYSMFDRALDLQRAESADAPRLAQAQVQLRTLLAQGLTDLETHLPSRTLPIRAAVQLQLGALLAVLPQLKRPTELATF